MMNDVIKELENTKADLISTISAIKQEQFNTVPFEGSWTAGQVSDHILKAIGTKMLYADTLPTERPPDEKIAQTRDLFLNFDIKMQSPDFILPSDKPQNKHVILGKAEGTLNLLIEAAKTLDLSPTCTTFELPGFGAFTRLEFVWFFVFHTQRHIHQLKNITKVLAKQPAM